ncbi:hypothetical protein [Megamonas hypermegale]|uniref:hypothetical protein n=1 Tax=Megamonas hypermegale TaxID=158847 RepID=UPI0026F2C869|nr:hypothetical protein [Megamonas hypermegale]
MMIMDMNFLKDHIFFVIIICIVFVAAFMWLRPHDKVQAQQQEVGKSDFGVVYIDTDTVDTVKKDNMYYLIVSVEERYTDETFLQQLRQSEETKDAVSALDLYMFTNTGGFYCVPQRYLVDKDGKVCADLGSDMQMKPVDEKIISDIYVNALKVLENKQRFQSMMNK